MGVPLENRKFTVLRYMIRNPVTRYSNNVVGNFGSAFRKSVINPSYVLQLHLTLVFPPFDPIMALVGRVTSYARGLWRGCGFGPQWIQLLAEN